MNKLRKKSMYGTMLSMLASMVLATSAMGFIFLLPVVYKYAKSDKGYEAQAQMPAPPEKVYSVAVSMAEEKAPEIKIVKKEEKDMYLEVTDGKQTASLKVKKAEEEGKCEITVTASVPKEEGQEKKAKTKKEKELALRIVENLCAKLQVECTVAK